MELDDDDGGALLLGDVTLPTSSTDGWSGTASARSSDGEPRIPRVRTPVPTRGARGILQSSLRRAIRIDDPTSGISLLGGLRSSSRMDIGEDDDDDEDTIMMMMMLDEADAARDAAAAAAAAARDHGNDLDFECADDGEEDEDDMDDEDDEDMMMIHDIGAGDDGSSSTTRRGCNSQAPGRRRRGRGGRVGPHGTRMPSRAVTADGDARGNGVMALVDVRSTTITTTTTGTHGHGHVQAHSANFGATGACTGIVGRGMGRSRGRLPRNSQNCGNSGCSRDQPSSCSPPPRRARRFSVARLRRRVGGFWFGFRRVDR